MSVDAPGIRGRVPRTRSPAFVALKYASFTHSAVYTALLVAAISGGETLALGWIHGIGWIVMSLACLAAVQRRLLPVRVAVAVVVLGGVGPFFGSYMFVREQRRQARPGAAEETG
jgi:hypothetical protein